MQNCCIKWLWVIVEQSCITLECITKITKVTKQLWSSSNITLYVRNWWFWASQNNNNFAENILKSAGSITKGINIEYEIHHHLGQPRRNEIISHNSNNASKLTYLIFMICDQKNLLSKNCTIFLVCYKMMLLGLCQTRDYGWI